MEPPAGESVLRSLASEGDYGAAEERMRRGRMPVEDDGPAAVAVDAQSRRVCNDRGIILEFHVWTEDRRRCERCGFTRS